MTILIKVLQVAVLGGLCVAFPTPQDVASSQAPTVHTVASREVEDDVLGEMSPEEGQFLEGDIVVDSEVIPLGELKGGHSVRNLVADPRLLWPAKTVYYQLPRGDHGRLARAVEEALGQIMAVSCVRFARRSPGQRTYLRLRATGKGCATKVGYHEDGALDLHVGGAKCHSRGTIQHEFLHALGFWHEHTRPDRDSYVSVEWSNVRPDYKTNFQKRTKEESLNLGLPYDYASVMHYKHTSFARQRGRPTLTPRIKEAVKVMGQRRGVTWVDVAKLNRLYNCSGEYYRGAELEGEGAVFGKIVEARVDGKEKLEDEKLQEVNEKETPLKIPSQGEKSGVQTEPSKNENQVYEQLKINGEVMSHRTKRQTGAAPMQPAANGGMSDQSAQNGGHENFAPQKILPELLKGVLNNDNNNERPIVIQFAIYQPVIYRSENKTDNPEEGNENKSKQTDNERSASGVRDEQNQRERQKNSRDSNKDQDNYRNSQVTSSRREDKYDRNPPNFARDKGGYKYDSQDYNRQQDRYNQNSQEYARGRDKYDQNPVEHQDRDDKHDLRISSDYEDLHKQYGAPRSPQIEYTSSSRNSNEKNNGPENHFSTPSDYSAIDRRVPYDRRTEYSSSFQISQKKGANSKPQLTDYRSSFSRPSVDDYNPPDDFSLKRIASIPKSDFQQSLVKPIRNDDYFGGRNSEYNPSQPPEIHSEPATVSKDDLVKIPIPSNGRDGEVDSSDRKTGSVKGGATEEFITPIPHLKYPVDSEVHLPTLKDSYDPLNHDIELSGTHTSGDHLIINPYGVSVKNEQDGHENHGYTHDVNVAHDEYHVEESKNDHLEGKIPVIQPTHDSESMTGHFTDSKVETPHSDPYISSSFNPTQTKSLVGDVSNEPKILKPLPAKSTEVPLDMEAGNSKKFQNLINSGDGENVAPNWKGEIANNSPSETPSPVFSKDSESYSDVSRPDMSDRTEKPPGQNSDRDIDEKKLETRPTKRPDIVTAQDKIDELDMELRRQKLEMKLLAEAATKRPENVVMTTAKAKYEVTTPRRVQSITKVVPPPSPLSEPMPTSAQKKRPSNPRRREVQEDYQDSTDADDELISKPNISRVNLNPRQALPLNANATVKMNFRRLFRKERTA